MTGREWVRRATDRLKRAGCEDAAFDARCLWEDLAAGRGRLPDERECPPAVLERLDAALKRRADGYPLQYLLGEWEFLSLRLRVGEGVLIPRPDTECLCEAVAQVLDGQPGGNWLDLCAGSGCVGLGIASLCPGTAVTAVELSEEALPYLRENVARYPDLSLSVRQADVLRQADEFPDGWDGIVSNPPYIPTGDLPSLQREVRCEPVMALDGDTDGLRFYRAIARLWTPKLRPGGWCAVEVGFDQAPAVEALFRDAGLTDVHSVRDLSGIARVVLGQKTKK